MRVPALSDHTAEGDQNEGTSGEWKKTHSMEMNKKRLELKTARAGPVLTNCSHNLEAVILKAAKERVRVLSRSRTTASSPSVKGPK